MCLFNYSTLLMDACCHCGGGAKNAGILQYVIKKSRWKLFIACKRDM